MRAKSFIFYLLLTAVFVGVNILVGLTAKPHPKNQETAVQAWWKEEERRLATLPR